MNNRWGTICDDIWLDTHATIVCQQLNLGVHGTAFRGATFGEGEGFIALDDVNCFGNEKSILSCQHDGRGKSNCGQDKAAGVRCSGECCAQGIFSFNISDDEFTGHVILIRSF